MMKPFSQVLLEKYGPDFTGITAREGVAAFRLRLRGRRKAMEIEGEEESVTEVRTAIKSVT